MRTDQILDFRSYGIWWFQIHEFEEKFIQTTFENSIYKVARIRTNKDLVNKSGPVHFLIYQILACNYGSTPDMSQIV